METYVVLGAAVKQDGTPSGAMQRRVEGALLLSRASQDPFYIVTGGKGRFGPPEANVMAEILSSAGVPEFRIEAETKACDTLSSVVNCTHIMRRRGISEPVFVCSDRYHIARCRWLFLLMGVRTRPASMPSGRAANGNIRWAFYYVRECFATPVDTAILIARRLSILGESDRS
jgi:vancomycin permeability regulator SanA